MGSLRPIHLVSSNFWLLIHVNSPSFLVKPPYPLRSPRDWSSPPKLRYASLHWSTEARPARQGWAARALQDLIAGLNPSQDIVPREAFKRIYRQIWMDIHDTHCHKSIVLISIQWYQDDIHTYIICIYIYIKTKCPVSVIKHHPFPTTAFKQPPRESPLVDFVAQ